MQFKFKKGDRLKLLADLTKSDGIRITRDCIVAISEVDERKQMYKIESQWELAEFIDEIAVAI